MNLKKTARVIISESKQKSVPIKIDKLVENAGLKILYKPLDNSISGVLATTDKGSKYIIVNSNHSPNRQRFSLAHEFAHYLLHRKTAEIFVNSLLFRDEKSSTGADKIEVEANKLAAELLMPEELIRKMVKTKVIDMQDEDEIKRLADNFEVSVQAMTFRLKNLNILGGIF